MAYKRPAANVAGGLKKKPAGAGDIVSRNLHLVAGAVMEATDLPDSVRVMLTSELKNSLGVLKEDRHDYQSTVITMVKGALDGVEAALKARITETEGVVATAETEKASRAAELEKKTAEKEEAAKTVEAKKDALTEAKGNAKDAKTKLSEALSAQKKFLAELGPASEKKEKIEAFVKDTLAPLKTSAGEAGAIKVMEKSFKEFGIDADQIKALSSALAKEVADRGTFDTMVVTKLDEDLAKMVETLTATITNGEPAKQEHTAAVDTAQAASTAAEAQVEACNTALTEAKAAEKDATAALKAAQEKMDSYAAEMESATDACASAKSSLSTFEEGAKVAFEELESRTAPPPPVEEPEPAEGAAPSAPAEAPAPTDDKMAE